MQLQNRKLRRYESIWLRLKNSKSDSCRIVVHNIHLLERIKKGVIKEKDMDLAFKLKNETEHWRLEMEYNEQTKELVFKLVTRLGIKEKII